MKMRRKMGRRCIALFLILLLSMNSLTVFAGDADTNTVQTEAAEVSDVTAQTDEQEVDGSVEEVTETDPAIEQETTQEETPASEGKEVQEENLAPEETVVTSDAVPEAAQSGNDETVNKPGGAPDTDAVASDGSELTESAVPTMEDAGVIQKNRMAARAQDKYFDCNWTINLSVVNAAGSWKPSVYFIVPASWGNGTNIARTTFKVTWSGNNTDGWKATVTCTCGNNSISRTTGALKGWDMSGVVKEKAIQTTFKTTYSNNTQDTTFYFYGSDGKPIQYKVIYNANGGTFGDNTAQQEYTVNKDATTPKPEDPERKDYTFKGWSPAVANTVTKDVTYTAQWEKLPEKPVDDGNGITITKTRKFINGDSTKTTAEPGDTITWDIVVKNCSNVEKTVTLKEVLSGTTLSKESVTLAAGGMETVTATYIVTEDDAGKKLTNTVNASTGGEGEKENPSASDKGTDVSNPETDDTYTVIYKDSEQYGGKEFQKTTGLNEGDSTPGYSADWFADKDKDFYAWSPKRENIVGGEKHTIIYTAVYKSGTEKYPFRIYYNWAGATEKAAPDYTDNLYRGDPYEVVSPTLDVPFEYAVNYSVIKGTVGYTTSDVKYWVTYTPIVKLQHIYRVNGKVEGEVEDTITRQVPFSQTLTADSYGITKKTSYGGKTYTYTSADAVTLPSEPSQLKKQPVLKLYYDRIETGKEHNVTVHYKWAGTDVKAAEDQVVSCEEGKFYLVNSPAGITTASFENIITDNTKMTISGIMGTEDIEKTVYYSPQYRMKYILQENGVTKYAGYYNGIWPGAFGQSYTANIKIGDSYWSGDPTWGEYYCTKIDNAVIPANPTELKGTPAITLYFNKNINETNPTMLTVVKTADKSEVKAGDPVDYTITVTNTGEVDAKDVKVRDVLPEGLEFVSASMEPDGNVYAIGDIPVGQSRTLTIKAKVKDTVAAGTEIVNTATAEYTNKPEDDPDPSGEAKVTVTEEEKPEDEKVTITLKYVYVDENGSETELKEAVEISVTKGGEYDVNDQVPETIVKDEQSYKKSSVDGDLKGTADESLTITVKYVPDEESKEPDPMPEDPTPEDPTPEDPTPENPMPEDPTPEDPTPEDPTPENPTPENPTPVNPTPEDPTPENPTPEDPTPENPTPGNPGTTTPGTTTPGTTTPGTTTPGATTPVETPVTPGAPAVTPIAPAVTPIAPTATPAAPAPTAPVTPVVTPVATVPTPTPVTPAVTPAALTPVTPALTPNAEAATPGGQTEIQAVPDDETPLANADLEDEEVPLAGNSDRWALINFALMNLSVFESLMLLIGYFIQTKKSSEEEEEEEDEKERKLKKKGIIRIVSLPIAIISLIAFFLTENIWLPTRLVDQYTLMMAVIAVIQTIMVVLSRKEEVTEEEEPEAEMA